MTSVRDSVYYWTYVNYYFLRNELIKVETGDWNRERKLHFKSYYYTKGPCQPFILERHWEMQRKYYKRLSEMFLRQWRSRA